MSELKQKRKLKSDRMRQGYYRVLEGLAMMSDVPEAMEDKALQRLLMMITRAIVAIHQHLTRDYEWDGKLF